MATDISTDYTIGVYPDPTYHYEVSGSIDDELKLVYKEDRDVDARGSSQKRIEAARVSFGNLDEMEAVAQAMLSVVKLARGG